MSDKKVVLQSPYSETWKAGYIVINRDNRRTLILVGADNKPVSSTQYARYLISVKLGRFLTSEETVDHIDGDKTNDSIDNLQVMSRRDNLQKQFKKPDVTLVCPICNTVFKKSLTNLRGRKHRIKENLIACSRYCGGRLSKVKREGTCKD